MKSYIQFIKENNYIQEKLDATVYGEVKYGASASKPKTDRASHIIVGRLILEKSNVLRSGEPFSAI